MTEVSASATIGEAAGRGQVMAWGLWDWGSSAFQAVTLTFVFSVYLTDKVGKDLPGTISASAWLGWALAGAGLVVALTAPVCGQYFDAVGSRKRALATLTALTVGAMALMFFVHADYRDLWLGLALLGFASATFELATVPYNAMMRQVSTPATVGRVSGFGWAMGYFGGIVLLLACYAGFLAGDGDRRGLLDMPTDQGLNVRLVIVLAAVWFTVFALPVLFTVPELPRTGADPGADRVGFLGSYRVLWRDVRELWRTDRHTVWFLLASAIFRDGLAGVFTFGAVLAVGVYGFADADVLLFGVAANVVAGAAAITAGRFDDRLGPKRVIVGSLIGMIICGAVLLVVTGPLMFWVFGLALTVFVGPAQASARSFLARLAPPGREGQLFGLYTTTGRAVSFLAPALFGLFAWAFHNDRAGIVGLLVVLTVGLLVLLPVRAPSTVQDAKPV
ncbi:MFS transporter [Nocardia sp. NPDC050378]|uniref:MFS transporter n=1 Tax=Nocardia sp. NPDC050378 TaxID=3155400 RepID=UPI0033CE4829